MLLTSLRIIFILFILIWGIGFVRSGIKWKNIYTPTEGMIDAALLRFFLLFGIGAMVVFVFDPHLMDWSEFECPTWMRVVGIPIGFTSLILLFWEMKSLGFNFSPTLSIHKNHVLITTGIYQWVRHPMYMTLILLWIAFFLLSSNWFIGMTSLLAYGLIILRRLPKEEKMLLDYFGDDYREYIKNTGRLLPKFEIFFNKRACL